MKKLLVMIAVLSIVTFNLTLASFAQRGATNIGVRSLLLPFRIPSTIG